ncbi:hypothetical protein SK128_010582 [Halocaridina rubra]|uniref:KHDC4/BBP-like KH-domain type I domain-containing protein n=1 Tax=Halocaridina rubra TaxID=373956 RepID=A0AAN9A898_HALRR
MQRVINSFLQFNFVGKLLGPKGNSLKRLQEETMTKMAILGRGSMRDKQKTDRGAIGAIRQSERREDRQRLDRFECEYFIFQTCIVTNCGCNKLRWFLTCPEGILEDSSVTTTTQLSFEEEELRISGDPKFGHLSEDLHVEVTAVAPPAEAHARIAYALTEIRRYLVPDYNDDIRQEQMREMQLLVGTNTSIANNGTANSANNNNGTANGSDGGSCSPQSEGSPPPPGMTGNTGRGGGIRAAGLALASPHPALRGLNRAQAALLTSGEYAHKEVYCGISRVWEIGHKGRYPILSRALTTLFFRTINPRLRYL